jgi:Flp pilus assembly protein TadD
LREGTEPARLKQERRPAAPARQPRPAREPAPRSPAEPGTREQRLAAAVGAAGAGRHEEAFAVVASLLTEDVLDADAHFLHGLVALEAGEAADAADALRRALYADPSHSLAAFTLGRACDALGDAAAARRAYRQALHALDPDDRRHEGLLQQIDLGDIAAACRTRLGGNE